jgi:hypothetical protein
MEFNSRRRFVGLIAKTLGVLSIAPLPLLKAINSFGAEPGANLGPKPKPARTPVPADQFQLTLGRATRDNLKQVLDGAPLGQEEKLAIAAVRELRRSEVEAILLAPGNRGPVADGSGIYCGDKCGSSCGDRCGDRCGKTCSAGVIDQNGMLGIKLKSVNRELFTANLRKALHLITPPAARAPAPITR